MLILPRYWIHAQIKFQFNPQVNRIDWNLSLCSSTCLSRHLLICRCVNMWNWRSVLFCVLQSNTSKSAVLASVCVLVGEDGCFWSLCLLHWSPLRRLQGEAMPIKGYSTSASTAACCQLTLLIKLGPVTSIILTHCHICIEWNWFPVIPYSHWASPSNIMRGRCYWR